MSDQLSQEVQACQKQDQHIKSEQYELTISDNRLNVKKAEELSFMDITNDGMDTKRYKNNEIIKDENIFISDSLNYKNDINFL